MMQHEGMVQRSLRGTIPLYMEDVIMNLTKLSQDMSRDRIYDRMGRTQFSGTLPYSKGHDDARRRMAVIIQTRKLARKLDAVARKTADIRARSLNDRSYAKQLLELERTMSVLQEKMWAVRSHYTCRENRGRRSRKSDR
jgi:hypothetical protein